MKLDELVRHLSSSFMWCSGCGEVSRLSECGISTRREHRDFLSKLDKEEKALDAKRGKFEKEKGNIRAEALGKGRKAAEESASKIDKVFLPLGLCADDSKVIVDPVEYLVFDGMHRDKDGAFIGRITFLHDKENLSETTEQIRNLVESGQYSFSTLRVKEDASIEKI